MFSQDIIKNYWTELNWMPALLALGLYVHCQNIPIDIYKVKNIINDIYTVKTLWYIYIQCKNMINDIYYVKNNVIDSFSPFFHLGFVHPLQDVALHQCLPLSSVCCFTVPGGPLLPCYVVLPSSAWSSPWSLPSPWLPLCAAFGPPIVLHSCYMSGPSPFLFRCVWLISILLTSWLMSTILAFWLILYRLWFTSLLSTTASLA